MAGDQGTQAGDAQEADLRQVDDDRTAGECGGHDLFETILGGQIDLTLDENDECGIGRVTVEGQCVHGSPRSEEEPSPLYDPEYGSGKHTLNEMSESTQEQDFSWAFRHGRHMEQPDPGP